MPILDFIKSPISAAGETLFKGVGDIISKFKADPTKLAEAEAELKRLQLTHEETMANITAQAEAELTKRQQSEDAAVTARWQADLASDNQLSKYVRPLTMLSLLAFIFIIIITDSIEGWKFDVKPAYIDLLQMLLVTTVVAYFGGRTYEKVKRSK